MAITRIYTIVQENNSPPGTFVQIHYAVMVQGYMIVADCNPLETAKRETRELKTLNTAARFLFNIGVGDFAVKLKTTG